ncbi:MAG: NAD-dependent epimerase/dehydratase family protein [Euzebyales bacterium]|nr:NAD-dependent epimerase/dehydratase family protein [Euzebyales bacterium]MBA3620959.1 NAD-dependent epimerase/dehydratase family protein [Euzebyales bacterium]
MRVAVLGGTRFIGVAIVERLVAVGHDVVVIHRGRTEAGGTVDVPHVHTDRRDVPALSATLRDAGAEVLVDTCAWTAADAESGVAALPEGCRAVVLSSMDTYRAFGAVHGRTVTDPLPLDEESPVRTQRYLFAGTRRDDDIDVDVDRYENLDVEDRYLPAGATVLRLPMVYGERDPQRREEFVLRRVRAGRTRIPFGAGTFLWTRGWVRDVAEAVRLAVERDVAAADARARRHPGDGGCLPAGRILNVGEARTWPVRQWAEQILTAAGSRAELVAVPDDGLPDDLRLTGAIPQHLLVSSHRIRAALGWADTDPVEALRASVRWHLDHPPPAPDDDFSADDAALATAG